VISIAAGGDSHHALNDNNELVFEVAYMSGNDRIIRFIPDLHYRAAASGQWSVSNHWTLGILPDAQYNVLIDPPTGLTVNGPRLPTTVRMLTIGATGGGIATLNLDDEDITATFGAVVTGNGHLHFYPLLDFTDPATADTVLNMTDEFYDVAISHGGGICGEHNDGIIRTPFLDRMYDADILTHFEAVEHTFDQNDIFNPGKKVHPKYDLRSYLRTVN